MPNFELTDDEAYWVAVAIENSKDHAERLAEYEARQDRLSEWTEGREPGADIDNQLDAGLLIQKYTELQEKFPPPMIGKEET